MDDVVLNARSSTPRSARWAAALRKGLIPYGSALAAVLVALIIRLAAESVLQDRAAFMFFVPAILVGSGLGGWWPGLFATVVGLILGLSLLAGDYVNAAAYALVGIGAAWRGELLYRSRRNATASTQEVLAQRGASAIHPRLPSPTP